MRYLINKNGTPFEKQEIKEFNINLDSLKEEERIKFRNENVTAIVKNDNSKMLIVSGPGTGKSFLFLSKINQWHKKEPYANILITSFVRKLVVDLQNEIDNETNIPDEQKKQTSVSTLHKFARSIVERNKGTSKWKFHAHFKIIDQYWKDTVWKDVLAFHSGFDSKSYSQKEFEKLLHNNLVNVPKIWKKLIIDYFKLCEFYNAAGFNDLIIRARIALNENPKLIEHDYFIIDEYQDFNKSEEDLLFQLIKNAKGLLIVGDDDQVLYEKLKSGKAELIRELYMNKAYANAILPYSSRCNYHITKAAAYFIKKSKDPKRIEKVFLPLSNEKSCPKIEIIASATPSTTIDYIKRFLEENGGDIDERRKELLAGNSKDSFLLILSQSKKLKFFGKLKDKIQKMIYKYQTKESELSEDYYKLLHYYSLAKNNYNNFTFRKVLYYEKLSEEIIHSLIAKAIQKGRSLCQLDSDKTKKIIEKCNSIKEVIDSEKPLDVKLGKLSNYLSFQNTKDLLKDINYRPINNEEVAKIENEEEEAELELIEVKRMCAVELMTIMSSKGLSSDHVIILGFDDMNMKMINMNAFYVSMTRARKSLQIITTLKSGGAKRAHDFLDYLPNSNIRFFKYKKTNREKSEFTNKKKFKEYIKLLGRF